MTAPPKRRAFVVMPFVIGAGLLAALYIVAFVAPPIVRNMTGAQPIFYFHVASAFSALIGFIGCALLSAAFLVTSRIDGYAVVARICDRLAVSLAEVGVLFGIITLVTGPLWAKPEWGEFWTWEPRLVLMLLTEFLFIGYVVLRAYARADDVGKRLAAGVAMIGGPAVYLIHVAVEKWGGNHPAVVTEGGGGLDDANVQLAFAFTLAAVFCFVLYLIFTRYRHHQLSEQLDDAYLWLSDLEEDRR